MDPFGWLSSSRVWHPPTGNWVTAEVSPGGSVSLSGHRWLHPNLLREVAAELELIVQKGNYPKDPLDLNSFINRAWELWGRQRSHRPSYPDILQAFNLLTVVAERVRR